MAPHHPAPPTHALGGLDCRPGQGISGQRDDALPQDARPGQRLRRARCARRPTRPHTRPRRRHRATGAPGIGCDQFILLEPAHGRRRRVHAHPQPGRLRGRGLRQRHPLRRLAWSRRNRPRQVVVRTITGDLPTERCPAAVARPIWARPGSAGATCRWPRRWTRCICRCAGPVCRPGGLLHGQPARHLLRAGPRRGADLKASARRWSTIRSFPSAPISASRRCWRPTASGCAVWERGAGLTLACGSGACAALVNAARRGLTGRRATVRLPWRRSGDRVARRMAMC